MATWRERWLGWWRKSQGAAGSTAVVWHLQIERNRASIGRLNDRLEKTLSPSVPEGALRALQVTLDELLTNIVMHGGPDAVPIDLKLARTADAVDATISYAAAPFDPTVQKPQAKARNVEDSQVGGHGIRLVRALMDEFRHEYVEGRNVVHLRKHC